MSFINLITPKETEEIKPNCFVQQRRNGYRQIYPSAWNGKIIWKNFLFGGSYTKGLLFFMIILFLVWSYQHDTKELREFYEEVGQNQICLNALRMYPGSSECTKWREEQGLCSTTDYKEINTTKIGDAYG